MPGRSTPDNDFHEFRGGVVRRARQAVSRLPWWLRWPVRLGVVAGVLGVAAIVIVWIVYSGLARSFDLQKIGTMPERSVVRDVHGTEMGRLHGENRIHIKIGEVSPHFVKALLAREDDRFYQHGGVDYYGLARALVRDIRDRSFTQGGSTITMQLARNSFAMPGKSLHRKLLEMALARRIEANFTKDEILEHYVNRVFFGTGIYGVERASQAYFGKPAKGLTLDEAAMLAAIIRGPNKFSPFRAYDVAVSGRNMVLDRMVVKKKVTTAEADAAKKSATKVLPPSDGSSQETYALDAVRRDLDRLLDIEDQEDGGLQIFTTIDLELQHAAEHALDARLTAVEKSSGYSHPTRAQFAKRLAAAEAAPGSAPEVPDYVQGSVIAIDNSSGAIRAIVGGRDFRESRFNRAVLAMRQAGSSFKPFVYAAAIQNGMWPSTLIDDGPVAIGGWAPHNSDGTFGGPQPAEVGLYKSRNTMTVRVGEIAGLDHVTELAERARIGKIGQAGPQLFIGNLGVTLRDLTSAYTAFPNAGQLYIPFVIDHIDNARGEIVFRNGTQSYPVMTAGASWLVTGMLEKVLGPAGTGASARSLGFKSPAAGKTGTTDDFKDAWFIGYNRRLTCGVWVGMDQPQRITVQGYGSKMALPVWVDVMKAAEKCGYPAGNPRPDLGHVVVEKLEVCAVSGRLATSGCRAAGMAVVQEVPTDLIRDVACEVHAGQWLPGLHAGPAAPAGKSGPSLWDRIKSIFR